MAMEREEALHDIADRALRQSLERAENVRAFLEQVVPDIADRFVYDDMFVLPRDFPMDDWRRREADLLIEIPYRLDNEQITTALVCLLIEHQSDLDPRMPLRTLTYTVLYWDRQWRAWEQLPPPRPPFRLRPVLPIVLYTGPLAWGSNRTLAELLGDPEALHRFAPRWEPIFWNLAEQQPQTLLQSAREWLNMMAVIRVQDDTAENFAEVFAAALRQLQGLADVDKVRWTELTRIVMTWASWHRPPQESANLDATIQRVIADAQRAQEIRAMKQTIARGWVEEGIEEGIERGTLKTLRESIVRIGSRKCGTPTQEVTERLNNTQDVPRLERWLDISFTAVAWSEILETP